MHVQGELPNVGFLVELDSTLVAGEEPDLSATLGLDDTGISFVAASSGLHSRQTGDFTLDETLPSDPDALMSSSPVRPLGANSEGSRVTAETATAEAAFWDGQLDVVAGDVAPAADTSVAAPLDETAQPATTTAVAELENGKS